jgi:D-beta-D-heptose 7-phosphate kinase/D-beta-D-heptose 1-phosphate adenosyltransferase|tara:strand:+ start:375 stop:917 length:543 start_codon:yes stop_codon:yes gene_type:complete
MSSVVVSGGFDPIHIGHIRMFNEAKSLANPMGGELIVIINSDDFLEEKKGYVFMPFEERMEVIANLKAVDRVVASIDKDETVIETLRSLFEDLSNKISIFANGGDRKSREDVPEFTICQQYGVGLLFGLGGEKTQASSNLVNNVWEKRYEQLSGKKLPSGGKVRVDDKRGNGKGDEGNSS